MNYFLQFANQIEAIPVFYAHLERFQRLECSIPTFQTIYLVSVCLLLFFFFRESLVNAYPPKCISKGQRTDRIFVSDHLLLLAF